jgi:hypothetical protein
VSGKQTNQFEQLKWFLLEEASTATPLGSTYGVVPAFFPNARPEDAVELVGSAILRLFDEGLIDVYCAEEDIGYLVGRDQARLSEGDDLRVLEREEIVRTLHGLDDRCAEERRVIFFHDTAKGSEFYLALPEGAVPELDGWTSPYSQAE